MCDSLVSMLDETREKQGFALAVRLGLALPGVLILVLWASW